MQPRVALTFDTEHQDRPHPAGGEARVLEQLARAGIRATFFLQGRWVEAFPDTARSIAAAGHRIANHSYYHVRMPLLTAAGFARDVRAADAAIREHVGADPQPWFRLPFGAGANDPALHARLATLGYRHVGWDVDGMDWEPGLTETALAASLEVGVAASTDEAIVLLHAWPGPTAGALALALPRWRDAGATFVTVDELADEVRATIPA